MATINELFLQWRDEITAELAELASRLEPARAAARSAELTEGESKRAYADLLAALDPLRASGAASVNLAPPLFERVRSCQPRQSNPGAVGLRELVASLEYSISERQSALEQLDRLLRPKAPPEYEPQAEVQGGSLSIPDNIVVPKAA